jgi:hypothetical protein
MSNIGNGPSEGKELGRKKSANVQLVKNNGVDDGVVAFGLWLNSRTSGDESQQIPMSVKKFVPDTLAILYDRMLQKDVSVELVDGVPTCRECADSNDCAHVGFAVCLEQRCKSTGLD